MRRLLLVLLLLPGCARAVPPSAVATGVGGKVVPGDPPAGGMVGKVISVSGEIDQCGSIDNFWAVLGDPFPATEDRSHIMILYHRDGESRYEYICKFKGLHKDVEKLGNELAAHEVRSGRMRDWTATVSGTVARVIAGGGQHGECHVQLDDCRLVSHRP